MGNLEAERRTFGVFLQVSPDFAGDVIEQWEQPKKDPPDVSCLTASGRKIGIELTEWLDEGQIANAKLLEGVQDSILNAISPEPVNNTQHIARAWLQPHPRGRVKPNDAALFREELLKQIDDMDHQWSFNEDWHSRQGYRLSTFDEYPILAEYISYIRFFFRYENDPLPRNNPLQRWLTFANSGGPFSPESMRTSLIDRLKCKLKKYPSRPVGVDEFYLVLHYDQAMVYNTPVETPTFKFDDAAFHATAIARNDPGCFDRIFILVPHDRAHKVYKIFP